MQDPSYTPLDVDECLANTDACDQVCTNTIGSFQCCCINGYTLSSDGRSCLDVNECTGGTHNCQQSCININGGFLCSCNLGHHHWHANGSYSVLVSSLAGQTFARSVFGCYFLGLICCTGTKTLDVKMHQKLGVFPDRPLPPPPLHQSLWQSN